MPESSPVPSYLRHNAGGLARTTTNYRVRRIKQMFRWGVENELVPSGVYGSVRTVASLRRDRTKAREPESVKPAPEEHLEKTLPHLPRAVAGMVSVQRLTGMRPGEVRVMRTGDIDQTGEVWLYVPHRHKNLHRDHSRVIAIGPRAQLVLEPFLRDDPDVPLFSPKAGLAKKIERIRGEVSGVI